MPNRCVFVESVEFEPLESGNLHFTIITGGERMPFCISRGTAVSAAYGAIAAVADASCDATVIPFERERAG